MRVWQHDTLPAITHTLSTTVNGVTAPQDLVAGVQQILCIARQNGSLLFSRTVTGSSAGVITHQWQTGDTDAIGIIIGEYQVTFANGQILTFRWSETVSVHEDLG